MQAEALDTFAKIDAVVNINIDFSLLMDRLCGRRVCKECGESYHVSTLNGAEACSRCGGALYQRKDDNPETVGKRLDVYKEQTAPLIEILHAKGHTAQLYGQRGSRRSPVRGSGRKARRAGQTII